jgi:uncharacterized protein YdaU (DUF1376 family)
MSSRPYYKRFASDFIAGVSGMSAEQIGVYSVLLDLMYARRKKLETRAPKAAQGLARTCGCTTRRFNQILDELLGMPNKITRDAEGRLSNPKFDRMMAVEKGTAEPENENESGAIISNLSPRKTEIIHRIISPQNEHTLLKNKDLTPVEVFPTRARARPRVQKEESKYVIRGAKNTGSAATPTAAAEHMTETGFAEWLRACSRTIPKAASPAAALKQWLRLPAVPIPHMIAAWDAYIAHNREESAGHKWRAKTRHPESWLREKIYVKFLEAVEQRAEAEAHAAAAREARERERERTITEWNGKAETLIAAIGVKKFDLFVGATLKLTADGHTEIDFHARDRECSDVDTLLWQHVETIFGKGTVLTSDRRRTRDAQQAAKRHHPP